MKLKLITLLFIIICISGCISIQDTAGLLSHASHQSISLIEALENDGRIDLADQVAEHEEELASKCQKTNDTIMESLENDGISFNRFMQYIFGEIELSECQKASRNMHKIINEIIKKHPKYAEYYINIPELSLHYTEDPNGE